MLKFFFLLFALSLTGLAEHRNFVFILADDLGINDLGIEGSTFHETPNLDSLAKQSTRFSNGYSTCQVCSPSRASIMLGQYPATHGITDWIGAASGTKWNRNNKVLPSEYVHALPSADTSLAEAMRDGGYKTFFAGKWHIGGEGSFPEDHGFDINIGGFHAGSPRGGYFSPYNNPKMSDGPVGEALATRLANETASFIEKNKDEKFFAFLSFYAVHGPIHTTRTLLKKYQDKAKNQGLAQSRFLFDRTKGVRQVQDNPIYAGMMETMDDAVGIVTTKLKELGLDKNTVIIFTSDNGGVSSGDAFATSCLPLRGGKGRQWEGGIRQPFYISVPKLANSGKFVETPVTGADFFPTILDLAGLNQLPKQHVDGLSLKPLLEGKSIAHRDLFWHYPHYGNQGGEPSAIIRSGDWKLIHYYEDGRNELYKISEDIGEQSDLATNHPEVSAKLSKKLHTWLTSKNAKIPQADSRHNATKALSSLTHAKTKAMQGLEKTHAHYLNPEFKSNKKGNGFISEQ